MADQLKKKIVLITGGASSIGKAIALRLGREGAQLALTYCASKENAEKCKHELESEKIEATFFKTDLSKSGSAKELINQVIEKFGGLDILINNASIFEETPLGTTTEAQWNAVLATNVSAPFFLIQSAIPWLKKRCGAIVNISDVYGENPILGSRIPYCVSKAALNAITKAFARALAPDIRVNAVAPGAITFPENYEEERRNKILDAIPLKRMGHPADIAEAVAFLLLDGTYVTGQIISVDGGRMM